jgi:transcriptional regulator with XRE-family HTH domain
MIKGGVYMGNPEMKLLGSKIKILRKKKGYSQDYLARMLGISRTSMSLIEQGKRKTSAEELFRLSEVYQVTCDTLKDSQPETEVILEKSINTVINKDQIRINVPQNRIHKFREVLIYILTKVGSKPNINETVIYKLLYFIDFDFYEKYEEQLIGASYVKNTYGPIPYEFDKIVSEMIENNEIAKFDVNYHGYSQTKYLPLREPDFMVLRANELDTIDNVLNRLSGMYAKQISEYSHSDVPWLATEDGKIIDYESVFYRTPAYSVRDYSDDEI